MFHHVVTDKSSVLSCFNKHLKILVSHRPVEHAILNP